MLTHRYIVFTLACGMAACGSPSTPEDAAVGSDSGPGLMDAGGSPDDGGSPEDAAVGPVDAGREPCGPPGSMRAAVCGACGLAQEMCGDDGFWVVSGECLGQRACTPGSVETEATPMCGERARICDDTCEWRDWTQTEPDAECTPGATRVVEGGTCGEGQRTDTCNDACAWEDGECIDACGGTARVSPPEAEEICVPAGPFIRGSDGPSALWTEQPVAEVTLSAYYLGRFPVTNDRYRACVVAGACVVPGHSAGVVSYDDPTRGAYPVQGLSWNQARDFCTFDGGRVLPTEAQWEKAARGPRPRTVTYPWGDADICTLVPAGPCGFEGTPGLLSDEHDALPILASYYGFELLIGGGIEWLADVYGTDYYADPTSLVDPTGPPRVRGDDTELRSVRGMLRSSSRDSRLRLSRRAAINQGDAALVSTVRCARPGGS